MPLKVRVEPDELKILRFLNARMELTEKEKKYLLNKQKGFEGEVMFDTLTEKLEDGRLVLIDLLLEVHNTKFQIDTTIIQQKTINLFEIKNFEDTYLYKTDNFYYISDNREYLVQNPLDQLKRCITLLHQLLQKLGYHFTVQGWVIFINPEFTLYQAPMDKYIILPTQLNQFMKNLSSNPSRINGKHMKLAENLITLHQVDNPYDRVRKYQYGEMKKGILCGNCFSLNVTVDGKKLICGDCGHVELIESAILQSINEYKFLFPNNRITTSIIKDWCGGVESNKVIRKVLKIHFKCIVKGKYCYYE